jgi:paraquat-inducible protein B
MSAKANPVVVGSFVIAALVLLIGALLVFGGGRFFEERRTFVTYFEGSLKGLRVGSNVLFRGVRVGFVSDIRVEIDEDTGEFLVPVTFQILPEAVALVGPEESLLPTARTSPSLEELVQRGLRTRLEMESFVTGQLVIELDFNPEAPAFYRARPGGPPEIPSVPSNIQQVLERARTFITDLQERVDIDELFSMIINALEGIDQLVRSDDLHGALAGINHLAGSEDFQGLPGALRETLAELDQTLAEIRSLAANADQRMEPLVARAEDSLENLSRLMQDASGLVESLSTEVSADSELNFQMRRTLEESQAAARSLRQLAEFLERNPEALLRGRRQPRE